MEMKYKGNEKKKKKLTKMSFYFGILQQKVCALNNK